ncbi:MAG TPA: hypothetical protein PLD46_05915 [Hyphomicrobium sp.]|nr:hypothetical protein [Hyphomicrobium sp.]
MPSRQSGLRAPTSGPARPWHDVAPAQASTERQIRSALAPYAPIWTAEGGASAQDAAPTYHPAFERILKRLPEQHLRAFTPEQLMALSLASIPSVAPHSLDYRVSLPFFGRRFYLTILAGREQRSRARLVADGQLPVTQLLQFNPVAWSLLLALLVFGAMITLYIVKSLLGIDVFEDTSAMHDLMQFLNDPAHKLGN